jgi:hypothetical protein
VIYTNVIFGGGGGEGAEAGADFANAARIAFIVEPKSIFMSCLTQKNRRWWALF